MRLLPEQPPRRQHHQQCLGVAEHRGRPVVTAPMLAAIAAKATATLRMPSTPINPQVGTDERGIAAAVRRRLSKLKHPRASPAISARRVTNQSTEPPRTPQSSSRKHDPHASAKTSIRHGRTRPSTAPTLPSTHSPPPGDNKRRQCGCRAVSAPDEPQPGTPSPRAVNAAPARRQGRHHLRHKVISVAAWPAPGGAGPTTLLRSSLDSGRRGQLRTRLTPVF